MSDTSAPPGEREGTRPAAAAAAPAGAGEPVGTSPAASEPGTGMPAAAAVPPWFRAVVWGSLLGCLCALLPIPFLDDIALLHMRRRMVERLISRWGMTVTAAQLGMLAGGRRPWSAWRLTGKVLIYPFKKLLRKILYFLAVKDAVDTFSLLFHHGYLVHAALSRGALGGKAGGAASTLDDSRVVAVAAAVHGALAATDTRPLQRLLLGVLRRSGQLVGDTVRWLGSRLRGAGGRSPLPEVAAIAEEGASREPLGSPQAEQLLERLLAALWGEKRYLEHLDAELFRRL